MKASYCGNKRQGRFDGRKAGRTGNECLRLYRALGMEGGPVGLAQVLEVFSTSALGGCQPNLDDLPPMGLSLHTRHQD